MMFFNKKDKKDNKNEEVIADNNSETLEANNDTSNVSFDTEEVEEKSLDSAEEVEEIKETNIEAKEEKIEESMKENKKAKKEKKAKTALVSNPLTNYTFWLKISGGVLLLALMFALIFTKNNKNIYLREQLAVGVFGGIIFVYAIIRTIPLFKTLEKGWSKILHLIEIIVDLIVGGLLVAGGFNFSNDASSFVEFVVNNFKYLLGGVLYLRGLIYCITSIIFGEKSDSKQFVANILCLTVGVAIVCLEKFNVTYLGWILVVLSGASGLYFVGEGSINYANYRRNFKERRDQTEKNKNANSEIKDKSKDTQIEKDDNHEKDDSIKINPEIIDNNNQKNDNLYN